jgi:hypothetical protein
MTAGRSSTDDRRGAERAGSADAEHAEVLVVAPAPW